MKQRRWRRLALGILAVFLLMQSAAASTRSAWQTDGEIFAIFGVDAEDGEWGRSDCILLASLEGGALRLCSVSRDTLAEIHGEGESKLGHAYAFGGPALALQTIRENFGLEITHYAAVNLTSLPKLVDRLGGIPVTLSQAEWAALALGEPFLGQKRLSGDEALRYCRLRAIDSDDSRTARQRTLIAAMAGALRELPAKQLPEVCLAGYRLLRTNLGIGDLLRLGGAFLRCRENFTIRELAIPGDVCGAWSGIRGDGLWYYVYDLKEAGAQMQEFFSK